MFLLKKLQKFFKAISLKNISFQMSHIKSFKVKAKVKKQNKKEDNSLWL